MLPLFEVETVVNEALYLHVISKHIKKIRKNVTESVEENLTKNKKRVFNTVDLIARPVLFLASFFFFLDGLLIFIVHRFDELFVVLLSLSSSIMFLFGGLKIKVIKYFVQEKIVYFMAKILIKKSFKKNKGEQLMFFAFYEDYYSVRTVTDDEEKELSHPYKNILRIEKSLEYFYFHLKSNDTNPVIFSILVKEDCSPELIAFVQSLIKELDDQRNIQKNPTFLNKFQ